MTVATRSRKYVKHSHINYEECFCCGCSVEEGNGKTERHHFPVPHSAFGDQYVNCCTTCHDLIDRTNLENWSPFLTQGIREQLSINAWSLGQALVSTQTDQLNDYYGDELDDYIEAFTNQIYEFDEEDAWSMMKECNGPGRALAMKWISHCFNLQ